MPLAIIFLLCALSFPSVQSISAFFQENQPQEERPKPDPAQEAPKAEQPEASKPEQSTPPPAPPASNQQAQTPPPAASEQPANPPAESGKTKSVEPAEKPSSGSTKSTQSGEKCKARNSGPRKRIVRRGSTTDPTIQFSPGLTQQQASAQRQDRKSVV